MAAAAGEGNAVQELHCEHKAKAEGEGRDLAAAPPSLPPQKKSSHTHSVFGFNIWATRCDYLSPLYVFYAFSAGLYTNTVDLKGLGRNEFLS